MKRSSTDGIIKYMLDDQAGYAIALEGAWGSGKTRYCTGELAKVLRLKGFSLLRVSLFGVASSAEFYDRLASAQLRNTSSVDDGRIARTGKAFCGLVVEAGTSVVENKLKDVGITVELKSQLLTNLLGPKTLIVMDDVERRCSEGLSDNNLFGIINDLVEGQGCKVLLVTKSCADLPEEINEKLVWKRFAFDPDPSELASEILVFDERIDGVDANNCIQHAARLSHCSNARAMIKCRPLLQAALKTRTLVDESIDAENRSNAFMSFARYALLAACGCEPTEPNREDYKQDDSFSWASASVEYQRYSKLTSIGDFFRSGHPIDMDRLESELRNYISERYPGSPKTMELVRLLEQYQKARTMDDTEVSIIARGVADCLQKGAFDFSKLRSAISCNCTLRDIGFTEALDDQELLAVTKRMVYRDPVSAYETFHKELEMWGRWPGENGRAVMDELDHYIVDSYQKQVSAQIVGAIDCQSTDSGAKLCQVVADQWSKGRDAFTLISPSDMVTSFLCSDGASQYELFRMLKQLEDRSVIYKDEESFRIWVVRLQEAFEKVETESLLGRLRLGWIREQIEKLAMIVNQN